MALKRRIKLAWLALTKPHLFQPALLINKAVIRGKTECEVTFTHTNGKIVTVSFTLKSEPYQSPMEKTDEDTSQA